MMGVKIYDLECKFTDAFNDAIGYISCMPHTLKDVLLYGFNSVEIDGHIGYTPSEFPADLLNKNVEFNGWDFDGDGYRRVFLRLKD